MAQGTVVNPAPGASVSDTDAPDALAAVEVFRVGTFIAMDGSQQTITKDSLSEIADGYDAENHPAPVVIGHPETNAPAYGWVGRLWIEGEVLKASIRDAASEFVDMVKAGRYKRVSISLFLPASANNPVPGSLYIRHVGFLGGAAPAVPGLKPVKFAEGAACFSIAQDFAAPKTAEQTELEALRRETLGRKVEDLISQGKVLPVFKEEIVSFASHFSGSDTVSFSDGSTKPARDWFLDYLGKQPAVVSFGAMDLPEDPNVDASFGSGVVIPDGFTVDPRTAALAGRAQQVSREKGVSFSEALDMVTGKLA